MFARVKKSRQGDYLRIEVLHEDGLGRHDLQRQRGPGGGQKANPFDDVFEGEMDFVGIDISQ
jgi:hypothetical protein